MGRTVKTEMSDSVKIVGTPFEEGQDKTTVRKALRSAFPNYHVASILRDDEGERWLARLVESGTVHHKLADDEDAPFPIKELGPGETKDDGDSDSDSGDDEGDEPKVNDDDDELKDDEKPAEDDKGDVKTELAGLLKQFKKLLPALEKVVGPIDEDEGPKDLGEAMDDIGPVPGNGGPMGDLPPGGPPGAGGPPPGVPAPGRRPPLPPGAGKRPPGPPRPGVPTFTHVQELPLQRTADVTEDEAKAELLSAYPDYQVREFTEANGLYKVILERKPTT